MEPRPRQLHLILPFALAIVFILLVWGISPPNNYPTGEIVSIPAGTGLYGAAELLEEQDVIRSAFWFRTISIALGGERRLQAGEYYMPRPQNVGVIAWRVFHGLYGVETVKITIPEGFSVAKISDLFGDKFVSFDNKTFEHTAPEGYLFPDTYFIPVTTTASGTIKLLRDNFVRKIFDLMPEIEESGKSLEEVVTMASLIEGEANNQVDRVLVSAVLWKRLKIGMPLQVDVEKTTYEFQGLPDAPINNPGILSIQAAIHPTTTPYLYYLTGNDGKMHYAKTFEEHKANIAKYLQ